MQRNRLISVHLHLFFDCRQGLLDFVHVLHVGGGGSARRGSLPVGPQPRAGNVSLPAPAVERPLVPVQADVELQMDVLGEATRAELAGERLVPRVEPLVRLQVGCRAEFAMALAALVRSLTFKVTPSNKVFSTPLFSNIYRPSTPDCTIISIPLVVASRPQFFRQ